MQLSYSFTDNASRHAEMGSHLLLGLVVVRQELVQRRIEQANRNGQTFHGFEDAKEIFALERQQFFQRLATRRFVFSQDHLPHRR